MAREGQQHIGLPHDVGVYSDEMRVPGTKWRNRSKNIRGRVTRYLWATTCGLPH
jgi:hypothetical protein